MKFLMLTNTFLPIIGGAEIGLHNLAEGLVSLGHEVTIASVLQDDPADHKCSYQLLKLFMPRGAYRFGIVEWILAVQIACLARRLRPDAIIANFIWPSGFAVLQVRKLYKIPVFMIAQGADIQVSPEIGYGYRLQPRLRKRIEWAVRHTDGLIAISQNIEQESLSIGLPPERILVIPNGINFELLSAPLPQARAALGIPASQKVVLAVGRYHPKKGFESLVSMMPAIVARLPSALLVIVGKNISALGNLVKQNKVGEHVLLCAPAAPVGAEPAGQSLTLSQKIIAYYKSADLFVMPSVIEGLPVVATEILASGLPIVATRTPGAVDLIREEVNGRLVPLGDAGAFVNAVVELLQDDLLRERMGREAQQLARKFDRKTIAGQIVGFIQQTLLNN